MLLDIRVMLHFLRFHDCFDRTDIRENFQFHVRTFLCESNQYYLMALIENLSRINPPLLRKDLGSGVLPLDFFCYYKGENGFFEVTKKWAYSPPSFRSIHLGCKRLEAFTWTVKG